MSSLLPPKVTQLERALAETMARVTAAPIPTRDLWNPDSCPLALLPWLAWALSLDDWDVNWTEAQQRAAVKASYAVHRYKGTIGAVKDAINALGIGVQVQEWYNQIPTGAPYTYKLLLEIDQYGASLDDLNKILAVVDNAKNLRSHMTTLDPTVASSSTVYVGAVALSGNSLSYAFPATIPFSPLALDGSWSLDGTQNLDGMRN